MLRRAFIGVALALPGLGARAGQAAFNWQAYTADAFAADQAADKTILVAVHADWCPTCRKQAPILESLLADPAMSAVVPMRVNFDVDKEFLEAHRIAQQSTILVFKGDREVARVIAETDPGRLEAFVTAYTAG